ncbi:MAG: SapC family protein [Chitinispirillaceae bacterium]|nr:SapC family protein [Chitinispirillaceae bacterium]
MAKQLMIYENAQPVSKIRHRNWSVKTGHDFSFSKELNSVPVTAIEFPNLAQEFSIIFTGKDDTLIPMVILGVKDKENLFVSDDNKLTARYIPAFLRRYPFIFSSGNDNNLTLCIDESFTGCNQEGIGERLFDSEGEQTVYLKNMLGFLKEYQIQFNRTKMFCKKLLELDLLEPMNAQIKAASGERITLGGFFAVNRAKLKALSAENAHTLLKSDELELIYLHLHSMRNLGLYLDKMEQGS